MVLLCISIFLLIHAVGLKEVLIPCNLYTYFKSGETTLKIEMVVGMKYNNQNYI